VVLAGGYSGRLLRFCSVFVTSHLVASASQNVFVLKLSSKNQLEMRRLDIKEAFRYCVRVLSGCRRNVLLSAPICMMGHGFSILSSQIRIYT
jgi:hypothetical protein